MIMTTKNLKLFILDSLDISKSGISSCSKSFVFVTLWHDVKVECVFRKTKLLEKRSVKHVAYNLL
jgi:hypothetical protein